MSKPGAHVILVRLIVALPFLLGVIACSGNSSDCDVASGDCAAIDAGIAADTNSSDTSSGITSLSASDASSVSVIRGDTNSGDSGASSVSPGDNNLVDNSTEDTNSADSNVVTVQCSSPSSDSDGDGYGFENGVSCIAPVASSDRATPDLVTPDLVTPDRITPDRITGDRVVSVADITHIAVVTGQSNVEASETSFDAELDQPHPRAFAYTDNGWQVADLHQVWDDHAHPGNHSLTDPSRSPNNNFTFHYAKTLAQLDPDAVVAFIVLAAPGHGIANWDFETPFYLKMRGKITEALAQIPHRDSIDAMLWHQGESDWQFEGTSDLAQIEFLDPDSYEFKNYYPIRLRNVIANFRSELWARGNLPFICGETRIAEGVNRHLIALNSDDDPNSACVAATDLPPLLSDLSGVHFSAVGLRELGRRYAQQFLAIRNR